MSYQIIWKPEADRKFLELCEQPGQEAVVSAAAQEFMQLLRQDPLNVGESRSGSRRIAFVGRIAFLFSVHPDDQLIVVKSLWTIR